ncbi:hypothetical protein VPHF89G1_0031 [Vibrio phage F89 g1]
MRLQVNQNITVLILCYVAPLSLISYPILLLCGMN